MVAAGGIVYAADINNGDAWSLTKPLCRLVQSVAQSLTNNVAAALSFTTEDIDTHGFHDNVTNNTRITPSVAGYYRITGTLMIVGAADYTLLQAGIAKNGVSTNAAPHGRVQPGTTSAARSVTGSAIMSANGTTDYFEVIALQTNTAAAAKLTNVSSQFSSVLELEGLRPL
jgi:hypothetical protein